MRDKEPLKPCPFGCGGPVAIMDNQRVKHHCKAYNSVLVMPIDDWNNRPEEDGLREKLRKANEKQAILLSRLSDKEAGITRLKAENKQYAKEVAEEIDLLIGKIEYLEEPHPTCESCDWRKHCAEVAQPKMFDPNFVAYITYCSYHTKLKEKLMRYPEKVEFVMVEGKVDNSPPVMWSLVMKLIPSAHPNPNYIGSVVARWGEEPSYEEVKIAMIAATQAIKAYQNNVPTERYDGVFYYEGMELSFS